MLQFKQLANKSTPLSILSRSAYDTSTADGRRALARRLGITETEVLPAVESAGLVPYTTLSDEDVAEILRANSSQHPLERAWKKVLQHARAEVVRRCRLHLAEIKNHRSEVFGHTQAPFRDFETAGRWLLSVTGADSEDEEPPACSGFVFWLKGENEYRPYGDDTIIGRSTHPIEWLARAAGVSRSEAFLFILTDDVVPDPPVQVTIKGHYGRPPIVEIRAEDYVPGSLINYARSEGRRLAGLGERSRPGPRRENVSPPPRLLDLVVSGEVECTELGIEADAPTTRGPFWKFMAPGMDRRPDRYSSSFSRAALESDGVRSLVPDTITCEWDINPFQDFELFTSL